MKKPLIKWSPAQPIIKNDNIVSSMAREHGDVFGFKPSYDNKFRADMNFLLSDEYKRIWFNEKAKYDKDNYAKQQVKTDTNLRRRCVHRMMNIKNEHMLPPMQLKTISYVPKCRLESAQKALHPNGRYKTECLPKEKDETQTSPKKPEENPSSDN